MYTQIQYEQHDDQPTEDHIVHLAGLSWDDYERLLDMRGDHSAPRMAYLEGVVEIMSPSRTHEAIKSFLDRPTTHEAIRAYREALRLLPPREH